MRRRSTTLARFAARSVAKFELSSDMGGILPVPARALNDVEAKVTSPEWTKTPYLWVFRPIYLALIPQPVPYFGCAWECRQGPVLALQPCLKGRTLRLLKGYQIDHFCPVLVTKSPTFARQNRLL